MLADMVTSIPTKVVVVGMVKPMASHGAMEVAMVMVAAVTIMRLATAQLTKMIFVRMGMVMEGFMNLNVSLMRFFTTTPTMTSMPMVVSIS